MIPTNPEDLKTAASVLAAFMLASPPFPYEQ